MYDVPEESQPKRKKLNTVTSKLNSSVNGERSIKIQPTWKPMHIGQLANAPSLPFFGLNLEKILP
jgi:hypothetical protein